MNSSIQEEKGNPVVTLKAQAEKFDFNMLRAGKDNTKANSGDQAYRDIDRMDFIIHDKSVDKILIKALINRDKQEFNEIWEEYCKDPKIPSDKKTDQYKEEVEKFYNIGKEHANLLPNSQNGDYRPFAKAVFREMFKYAKAQVPSDLILEELITNCNQAGYEAALTTDILFPAFNQSKLTLLTPQKIINISCKNPNCVELKSHMEVPVMDRGLIPSVENAKEAIICNLQGLLGFTLEFQDGEDDITYTNGKLSLTVPRKLRDYKIDGRSLFDIIREYFYKFCEKLGFKFETEIGHNFEEEEYSFEGARLVFKEQPENYVEDPDVDPLSNQHDTHSFGD
ncbi:MAG: hypothetical protein ACR5K9_09560 [Wolbachia sp.]